jgi:isopropylmalate/homocitrate/citramalate synthase
VKWGMRKLGVQFNEEEAMKVVAAIKEFSLQRKRLLTDEEFREVVSATLPGKAVGSGKAAD